MSVDPDREMTVLSALSRGEIGTREAVAALDLNYAEILQRMGELDLPRYELPDDVLKPMVEKFHELLDAAGSRRGP